MADEQKTRIRQLLSSIQNDFRDPVANLLNEVSRTRLKGMGKLTAIAEVEQNNVRWTLEWQDGPIHFDLNVVAAVEDDGKQAKIGRVWVQRHASTAFDFDGHTPTTRMRRLTMFSPAEIREAIDAEWG